MKKRIHQLKQRRIEQQAIISGILAAVEGENRPMTEAEVGKVTAAETAIAAVDVELQMCERQAERDRQAALDNPGVDPDSAAGAEARRVAGVGNARDRTEDDPMRGFVSVADFARSVRSCHMPGATMHQVDPRLKAMWGGKGGMPVGVIAPRADAPPSQMQETHTTEGYEVPPQIREQMFELVFVEGTLLDAVQPEQTASNSVEINTDETTPWGSAGIQARWRSEATKMTPSELDTGRDVVRLHELYAFVLATDELLADAPRLNDRMTRKSAAAIRWKASESLVNGNGAGQPLGWHNAKYTGSVSVAKESAPAQPADTIVAQNPLNMLARLLSDGADMANMFWLANRDTLPQVATMTIGTQPVWTPPNQGMKQTPMGMLLGLPIVWSEHANTIGDQGDLQLINPNGYYAVVKGGPTGGVQFAMSIHLFFDFNLSAFRWIFRLGGQPLLSAPVASDKSADKKSHFVFLDERT